MVWDDIVNKWVPQFGFKKKQAEQEKNWCIPIKAEFHYDFQALLVYLFTCLLVEEFAKTPVGVDEGKC